MVHQPYGPSMETDLHHQRDQILLPRTDHPFSAKNYFRTGGGEGSRFSQMVRPRSTSHLFPDDEEEGTIRPTTRTEPTSRTNEMSPGYSEEGNMQQQGPEESTTGRYVISNKNRIAPRENDVTIDSSSEHSSEYRRYRSMNATGSSYSTSMQPYSDSSRRMSTTTNTVSRSYLPTRESINDDDSMTLSTRRIDPTSSSLWPTRMRFDAQTTMMVPMGGTTTVEGQQPQSPLPNRPLVETQLSPHTRQRLQSMSTNLDTDSMDCLKSIMKDDEEEE
jgi:hypothetical protein